MSVDLRFNYNSKIPFEKGKEQYEGVQSKILHLEASSRQTAQVGAQKFVGPAGSNGKSTQIQYIQSFDTPPSSESKLIEQNLQNFTSATVKRASPKIKELISALKKENVEVEPISHKPKTKEGHTYGRTPSQEKNAKPTKLNSSNSSYSAFPKPKPPQSKPLQALETSKYKGDPSQPYSILPKVSSPLLGGLKISERTGVSNQPYVILPKLPTSPKPARTGQYGNIPNFNRPQNTELQKTSFLQAPPSKPTFKATNIVEKTKTTSEPQLYLYSPEALPKVAALPADRLNSIVEFLRSAQAKNILQSVGKTGKAKIIPLFDNYNLVVSAKKEGNSSVVNIYLEYAHIGSGKNKTAAKAILIASTLPLKANASIKPLAITRFIEVRDAKLIQHELAMNELIKSRTEQLPNVHPKLDAFPTEDGGLVLLSELRDGNINQLVESMSKDQPLSHDQLHRIIAQMAEGVNQLHTVANIIHRDLQLKNFLYDNQNGEYKIFIDDFDLASSTIDKERFIPEWMPLGNAAPEFYNPKKQSNQNLFSTQTEMYAFGVGAYQILAGIRDDEFVDSLKAGVKQILKKSKFDRALVNLGISARDRNHFDIFQALEDKQKQIADLGKEIDQIQQDLNQSTKESLANTAKREAISSEVTKLKELTNQFPKSPLHETQIKELRNKSEELTEIRKRALVIREEKIGYKEQLESGNLRKQQFESDWQSLEELKNKAILKWKTHPEKWPKMDKLSPVEKKFLLKMLHPHRKDRPNFSEVSRFFKNYNKYRV